MTVPRIFTGGWGVGIRGMLPASGWMTRPVLGRRIRYSERQTLPTGSWHHIVATRDGASGTTTLYVDGALEGSAQYTYAAGFDSAVPVDIGWLNLDAGFHFLGILDEMALYTRALSGTEIGQHYHGGVGRGYCDPITSPAISVSPSSPPGFGTINVGSTSAQQVFTISNTGSADLNVSSIGMTGGDAGMFTVVTGGGRPCASLTPTITVGASCTITARFTPSSEGAKGTTLRISSDASNSPTVDLALSGTGTTQAVFFDVPEGFWAENYVNSMYYNGITLGCGGGNYCPSTVVTRDQMAVFIERALGVATAPPCTGNTFSDVNAAMPGGTTIAGISRTLQLGE